MSSDTVCCLAFSNNKKFDTNQSILISTNYRYRYKLSMDSKNSFKKKFAQNYAQDSIFCFTVQ